MRFREFTDDVSLFERRRNPTLNKKISALETLKKYAGRDDVFVSFTYSPPLGLSFLVPLASQNVML